MKSFLVRLGLIAVFLAVGLTLEFAAGFSAIAVPVHVSPAPYARTILLIPLDSRPPCTDYVRDLAAMAGIRVLIPPTEFLDNYRRPGNVSAIRAWAAANISQADAAILSLDMLIHGGLLASRSGSGGEVGQSAALQLVQELHDRNPAAKLYAFHIIPRLFIADNPATEKYKQPMAEWSVLQDTVSLFENPVDIAKLKRLEEIIPAEIRQNSRSLYTMNSRMNRKLVELTAKGVLTGLVLGQDDSAPFGLGNLERRRIEVEVEKSPSLAGRIFITRGTDEVALTLLGQVTLPPDAAPLKAYIHYTEPHAAETIMPYMPGTMARTVAEKMSLAAVEPAESESVADFILVVHAGDAHSRADALSRQADRIKTWLKTGRPVAVIDLSRDFRADQTLLPHLKSRDVPVYQLLAYAGWNTASNSTGTALTQSALLLRSRAANGDTAAAAVDREINRIGFLASRLLDDWYYQKVYRPRLNAQLARNGINPYGLQASREFTTRKISHQVGGVFSELIHFDWRDAVLAPPMQGLPPLAPTDWKLQCGLPWDRTFEIFVETRPEPAFVVPHP